MTPDDRWTHRHPHEARTVSLRNSDRLSLFIWHTAD